jgi:hypothetical protein
LTHHPDDQAAISQKGGILCSPDGVYRAEIREIGFYTALIVAEIRCSRKADFRVEVEVSCDNWVCLLLIQSKHVHWGISLEGERLCVWLPYHLLRRKIMSSGKAVEAVDE